jgi:hypothetical protein
MDGIIKEQQKNWKRIKKQNDYRFISSTEDEVIHIIKTGFKSPINNEDMFFVIFEDAIQFRNGELNFLSKTELQNQFNIKINF